MRFKEKKIAKEKFYTAKKPVKIWNVNVDNIIISKLVKIKTLNVRSEESFIKL